MNINVLKYVKNFSASKKPEFSNVASNSNSISNKNVDLSQNHQLVNASTALAGYKVPKINMSFKGSSISKEHDDIEFEKFKAAFYEQLKSIQEPIELFLYSMKQQRMQMH